VSARIEVQVTGDEALVTVRGVIDRTTPGLAAGLEELGEGCRAVVVDLCEAVLASREGVEDLVASLRQQAGTDRIALVCDRLPGRRLLRLACGASGVRILDEVPPGAGRRLPKPNRPVPVAERRRPRAPQVAEAV
jgi:hypothetical protein